MLQPIRVGIVGGGIMGVAHADVWASVPDASVVAVADPLESQRIFFAERYGCAAVESAEEMVSSMERPDVMIIATQAPRHCEDALTAFSAGCHVICEKPIACDLKEADRMVTAARRAHVVFAVHHQHIFTKAAECLKEMIERGEIGDLRHIVGWGKGRLASYELMEEGTHTLHLMYHIAGAPKWVFGNVQERNKPTRKNDAAPIESIYPQGRRVGIGMGGSIHGYYQFFGGPDAQLCLDTLTAASGLGTDKSREWMATEFHGTKGRLRFHHLPPGHLLYKDTPVDDFDTLSWKSVDGDGELRPAERSYGYAMRSFTEDFLEAIRDGRKPRVSGEDGRKALEMAHGIYWSHLTEKRVFLPLAERRHPLHSSG